MSPYGIRVVDDEPHGCPPWIMKVAVTCLILFGVIVVRMVIGLSADYLHYRATADFASFVTEYEVEAATLSETRPAGQLLSSTSPWSAGQAAEDESDSQSVWCEVRIQHGEESLLDAMVKVVASEAPGDGRTRSLSVSLDRARTDARMRAFVQVGVIPDGDLLEAGGELLVDVQLAAGGGEDSFQVVELTSVPPVWPDDAPSSLLRGLFGIAHPMSGLPEEGLVYHTRQRVSMKWAGFGENGSRLMSRGSELRLNCHEYSSEVEAIFTAFEGGRQRLREASSWQETYRWNERVW